MYKNTTTFSIGLSTHLSDMAICPFIDSTLGPAISVGCDPLELFSAVFDDTLIGLIVTETNKYAKLWLKIEGKQST